MEIIPNDFVKDIMSQNDKLRAELSTMKERFRSKSHKLRELEEELRSLHDESKRLIEKESSLRAIILQSTNPVQISDAEVNNLFGVVHQKLQAVSHSRLFDSDTRRYIFANNMAPRAKAFYYKWANSGKMERNQLIQADLYTQIHNLILDSDIFGFGQALNTQNRAYAEQDVLEWNLQRIEQCLKGRRGKFSVFKVVLGVH